MRIEKCEYLTRTFVEVADSERAEDVVGANVNAREAHLYVPKRVPLGVLRPVLVALPRLRAPNKHYWNVLYRMYA